jgi:hypothetical protein
MEDDWPGLWRLWFKHQCATVGYRPSKGFSIDGGKKKGEGDWVRARNALMDIEPGDFVVVALPGRRIGRIGEVIRKRIHNHEWEPLVERSPEDPEGHMGRRILVRWDLEHGPDDPDVVAQLPEGAGSLGRGTINRVGKPIVWFQQVMAGPANWVGLLGRFGYERALSDYIALYPHRLEGGLRAQPNKNLREKVLRVREKMFGDRSRLDVLLRDRQDHPVIVECKQDSPTVADVAQLRRYMMRLKKEIGEEARGILVHGGARRIDRKVRRETLKRPRVEVMQYKLDVDFAPSC